MDCKQSLNGCAQLRYKNYKKQPLKFIFPQKFTGYLNNYNIPLQHKHTSAQIKAAIIREKGTNGEREMAYMLYTAGFEVKDVTMTDLISGREDLKDINLIVFCGGFANSDVLGSAKGWAGAFLYNQKAQNTLRDFYNRTDTLSLGVCNGCQLMIELNLIDSNLGHNIKLLHNTSQKFESRFLQVTIPQNNSIMLQSLIGTQLGIWVSHGEGRFTFNDSIENYNIALQYSQNEYPGNPNGSEYNIAGICSPDGRHLAIMPHLERSFMPWQCAYYPKEHKKEEITPWIEVFISAYKWILTKKQER